MGAMFTAACFTLALGSAGCAAAPIDKPLKIGPIASGPESLEATRRALEGTWTLASAEIVDDKGAHRTVKASGQLTYDAFGNMSVHGTVEDATLREKLVLEYQGRIVIDPTRHQFYPQELESAKPVDPDEIARIAPDKVRHYELTATTLAVTYADKAGKTTAVIRWKR
jgi:hypothetical protein